MLRRLLIGCGVLASAGCGSLTRTAPVPALPFAADTLRAQLVRAGVTHWFIYVPPPAGPWAIHALVVDRGEGEGDACYSARAAKGSEGAVGREKTSAILEQLRKSADVVGGVNADFFLFTPPGLPTNALVSRGRVVVGPSNQPVLAFDSLGAPHVMTLRAEGSVAIGGERRAIATWNRAAEYGTALYDESWGRATDTLSNVVEVVLEGRSPSRVIAVDTATAGVVIPRGGAVLVARSRLAREALLALAAGDTLRASVSLVPFAPMEVVGGRPVLVRDSTIVSAVDLEGGPAFATGRHPRTAVGIARGGRRLLLVVVDGRQSPYSDGMTLRELATLMRALGARDAINLDGGGSTTLVYADPDASGALRIANRPSDAAGERPVGDALAIVRRCSR